MKDLITKHMALTMILAFIGTSFGFSFFGAMVYYTLAWSAPVTGQVITSMIGGLFIGILSSIIPLSYMYEYIKSLKRQVNDLQMYHQRGIPRRRPSHWDEDLPYVEELDDIDGDGNGDDTLRRLGVI